MTTTQNPIPKFDISNAGQVLKVRADGLALEWAADLTGGVPLAGGAFDSSPACGGGRVQVVRFAEDGSYCNNGGDQGGSSHCPDPTHPLYKWFPSNAQATDPNNDKQVAGMGQDHFNPNNWYKITDPATGGAFPGSGSFWASTDKGRNWTKDTRTGAPSHTYIQPGGAASTDPRVVDLDIAAARAIGSTLTTILVPDDNGVKRFNPTTQTWDTANFPAGLGRCICLAQNPNARRDVFVICATNVGGVYSTKLYRCTDFTVGTGGTVGSPTWVGPYTGGTAFAGVTFYPQRIKFSGNTAILWCLNPFAVNSNSVNEAKETGIFILNALTSLLSANFQQIGGTTVSPTRTSLSSLTPNCFDVKTDGVNTRLIIGYTNCTSTGIVALTYKQAGDLQSTSPFSWKQVLNGPQDNLINGVANTPHWTHPPGSNNSVLGSNGIHVIDINPANLDDCVLGALQGPWRMPDLSVSAPKLYPIHTGMGGATEFPGATFDSNGCQYYGMSDLMLVPAPPLTGGEVNPGVAMQYSESFGGRQSGSIVRHFSDDRVVCFARGDGGNVNGQGGWAHPPITNPLSSPAWPGGGGVDTVNWSDLNFPHTSAGFYGCGAVVKNGSGQDVVLTAQVNTAWYLHINGVNQTAGFTPPPVPGNYADVEFFADGSPYCIAYVDANGFYVSSDYGMTWSQRFASGSPIIPTIPGVLRNFCGFCKFVPGDHNRVIAASSAGIYYCVNIFSGGTPQAFDITGIVTRPGPIQVRGAPYNDIVAYQRNSATEVPALYNTPIPVGSPPATPSWNAFPDPNGRFSGQMANACKIVADSAGNLIISSSGGSHVVWQVNAA